MSRRRGKGCADRLYEGRESEDDTAFPWCSEPQWFVSIEIFTDLVIEDIVYTISDW